jgi:hypothetical protein
VDVSAIANCFVSNTSLQSLDIFGDYQTEALEVLADVLKHHNSTLQQFQLPHWLPRADSLRTQIEYYTMLNQYGRAQAQQKDTTLTAMVSLLVAVPVKNLPGSMAKKRLDILHGLLAESPSMWSTPV